MTEEVRVMLQVNPGVEMLFKAKPSRLNSVKVGLRDGVMLIRLGNCPGRSRVLWK